ncbi:helix-turn-helix transcriptional regulator [Paenibacillus tritici]|uniref:helix-turn-helix domain-containing protein n=1 Tax=Paenibacillus tritici TaxID=1873425 RepID=UPI001BAA106E|nr:helix-turn-helix transcriptional regulator [Paenibacillus tritici]QUL57341.1 helix-turn-helix transcriptional regulator [Paenibacillus tritici]
MAIGLQFICETYGMEYKELAQRINTSPQNINAWLREKRNIPPKRLDQLIRIFPNISSELFGKELRSSEKLLIQEIFYEETDEHEVVEYDDSDNEGNKFTASHVLRLHEGIISHLRTQRERQELLEEYESLIFDEGGEFHLNEKLLQRFLDILQDSRDSKQFQLLKLMFYYLQPYDKGFGFGSDPDLKPKEEQKEMYREFGSILKKYDFIDEF